MKKVYLCGRWKLEADREQVFPDDPGNGTPLLVIAPNGETGTLQCCLGEGEVSGDGQEIPEKVYRWLEKMEQPASDWVFQEGEHAQRT